MRLKMELLLNVYHWYTLLAAELLEWFLWTFKEDSILRKVSFVLGEIWKAEEKAEVEAEAPEGLNVYRLLLMKMTVTVRCTYWIFEYWSPGRIHLLVGSRWAHPIAHIRIHTKLLRLVDSHTSEVHWSVWGSSQEFRSRARWAEAGRMVYDSCRSTSRESW